MGEKEIILVDKPKGISSFDVIRQLRKKLGVRKMGHSGSLDPLATGLLLVGINEGTKKLKELIKLPKTYEAQILLGRKTTTGDLEGAVLEEKKVGELNIDKVKEILGEVKGKLVLRVPLYSAVKVRGRRLYKAARKGEKIEPPEKEMEIYDIEFRDIRKEDSFYILEVILEVKSGTYVRSVAEEIGRRLGLPATLKDLRRTRIGNYRIEDAEKL